ncbi:NADPH:adrenodoxin oxidoreductase, mitochondrial [Trichinella patagoniensis]|uniref:NADPH:adrenodoxin oxidoreductase, mitochondrial n=1 Tax=Trichinella patagoniensis TaxID=990121 RepID=A0A0V0ZIX4_9BILA|nr:NADPH:adrenodoxin oxidoreductase, mitochondrial [Trichinella patagoniensis]
MTRSCFIFTSTIKAWPVVRLFSTAKYAKRIAVVGSGPAGFYCSQTLLSGDQQCLVDVFEKYPVPYGLVRYGIAPDHQDLKSCINGFERTVASFADRFRFFGNVHIGKELLISELLPHYDAVVLAYGASEANPLPKLDCSIGNCFSARDFVGWYNGLPECGGVNPNLQSENSTAVVIGHGNVALDIVRVLLSRVENFQHTDIAEHALEALNNSRLKRVVLVGRRGPAQVSFTTKELRELSRLQGVNTIVRGCDLDPIRQDAHRFDRPKQRLFKLMSEMVDSASSFDHANERCLSLRFLLSFDKAIGDSHHNLQAVRFVENQLTTSSDYNCESATIRPTNRFEEISASLLIYSCGYRTVNIEPGQFPFDDKLGGVLTDGQGRVIGRRGLYACGWCRQGPNRILAQTQIDAKNVALTVIEDLKKIPGKNGDIQQLLKNRSEKWISWSEWKNLDEIEQNRGKANAKPRQKVVSLEEMISETFDFILVQIVVLIFLYNANHFYFSINKQDMQECKGEWKDFTFAVVADPQLGLHSTDSSNLSEGKKEMKNAILAINTLKPPPEFVVFCGDFTHAEPYTSAKAVQIRDFEQTVKLLRTDIKPIYVCGNHDIGDKPTAHTLQLYREQFGSDFYAFWVGEVKFFVFNSQYFLPITGMDMHIDQQAVWFENEAERTDKEQPTHVIAFQHIPPFINDPKEEPMFISRCWPMAFNIPYENKRKQFLEWIRQLKVKKLFCGHYHRNTIGQGEDGLEVIITENTAERSGFRLVRVYKDRIEHEFIARNSI